MSLWISEACQLGNLKAPIALRWMDLKLEDLIKGSPITVGEKVLGRGGVEVVMVSRAAAAAGPSSLLPGSSQPPPPAPRALSMGVAPGVAHVTSLFDEFQERQMSEKVKQAMKEVDLEAPDAMATLLKLYKEEKKRLTGKAGDDEEDGDDDEDDEDDNDEDDDDDDDSDDDSGGEGGGEGGGEDKNSKKARKAKARAGRAAARQAIKGPTIGVDVRMEGLTLKELGVVRVIRLRVAALCGRCGTRNDVSFRSPEPGTDQDAEVPFAEGCSRCRRAFAISARFYTAFPSDPRIATLSCGNCTPQDAPNPDVSATCMTCSGAVPFTSLVSGREVSGGCRQCHAKVSIKFDGCSLQRCAVSSGLAAVMAKANRAVGASVRARVSREKDKVGLRLGEPLPNLGACEHYKNSNKWFRFPCCGQLYPCDVCHNNSEAHEPVWATRVVCGHCSKEQRAEGDDGKCSHCQRGITTKKFTRHWEGGEGNRNKDFLDPRDAAKWRGSEKKTKSRKDERVGEKAKELREKKLKQQKEATK
jgi:hypothetical protein